MDNFGRRWSRILVTALLALVVGCQPTPNADLQEPEEPIASAGPLNYHHTLPQAQQDLPEPQLEPARMDNPLAAQNAPRPARSKLSPQSVQLLGVPAGTDVRVRMKLLLVTATADEVGFDTMKTFLKRIGVPFDTLVAATENLTTATLESEPGVGNYQGIILTTANLAYTPDGTNWLSAFDQGEWDLLAAYERDYSVRQAILYAFPDSASTGLVYTGYADTTNQALNVTLTAAGKSAFPELNPNVIIPIRYAWTYLGSAMPGAVPLLQTSTGGVVAATNTTSDGRQLLTLTMPHNTSLMHSLLLNYGVVRWVTRGVFLGERRMYFAAHADDLFIENDIWDVVTQANKTTFRARPTDMLYVRDWQNKLRTAYPLFNQYITDIAFNGDGYVMNSPSYCTTTIPANVDGLSAIMKCLRSNFRWINHTFSHIYIDDTTTQGDIAAEINDNIAVANNLGLGVQFDARNLVTGNHSGLGYLDEAIPPNNRGKSRSSPALISSAAGIGILEMGSNISAPTVPPICTSSASDCNQNNPSPNTGVWLPSNLPANNIQLQPRWPTNVFYNVTNPQQLISEYNKLYRAYWGKDLTYAQILDFETDTALSHVLSFSVDPHFFHQSNFRKFTYSNATGCLMCDFVQLLAKKYSSYLGVGVTSPSMTEIGQRMRARLAYDNASASAIWNKTTGVVRVSAANAATDIPLTNTVQGNAYGTDKVLSVKDGASVTVGSGN